MTGTGTLVGGVIGLGIGVAIADKIWDRRNRKKKKKKFYNWVEREVSF